MKRHRRDQHWCRWLEICSAATRLRHERPDARGERRIGHDKALGAHGECAETAAIVTRRAKTVKAPSPKLEGWLDILRTRYGVDVAWGPVQAGLVPWRRLRNVYVHELELGGLPGHVGAAPTDERSIDDLFDLIEEALTALDVAMSRLEG